MSIFGSIMDKIFHRGAVSPGSAPTSSSAAAPQAQEVAQAGSAASQPSAAPKPGSVDVEAVLTQMAGQAGQELNWRTSIVDLMKLLGLDSSLSARKQLASELQYTGDMNDSASMNVWLHKQVMKKLAENGGKVPDDLRR
jgi:Domain of unknown function (DUF3597)